VTPVQVVEPLYEYSWLYAAVEPTTGDAFWGALPRLEADCFRRFLRPFGPPSAASRKLVRLDQAPAHVAQRGPVPEHVVLVWLPASRPELTPVERLWEDLQRRIDGLNGQGRASLRALQEHVADLVQRSTTETIASLTGSAYVVEAVHASNRTYAAFLTCSRAGNECCTPVRMSCRLH
jgi:hypothetical protein